MISENCRGIDIYLLIYYIFIVLGESDRGYLQFHELLLDRAIVRPWHRAWWGQKKRRQRVSVVGSARRRTVASGRLVHQPRVERALASSREGARVVSRGSGTRKITKKELSASTRKGPRRREKPPEEERKYSQKLSKDPSRVMEGHLDFSWSD